VVAVRDLSLDVEAGQVYGLLGPNGSGKKQTMKIVLGLVPPTAGGTQIFGRDSSRVESREDVGFSSGESLFLQIPHGHRDAAILRQVVRLGGKKLGARAEELLSLVALRMRVIDGLAVTRKACCSASGLRRP